MTDTDQANDWLRGRAGKPPDQGDQEQPSAAVVAARQAGAIYPQLIAERIPEGILDNPPKLREAVTELRQQYPGLFHQGSSDGGAGGEGPQTSAGVAANDFIRTESARR